MLVSSLFEMLNERTRGAAFQEKINKSDGLYPFSSFHVSDRERVKVMEGAGDASDQVKVDMAVAEGSGGGEVKVDMVPEEDGEVKVDMVLDEGSDGGGANLSEENEVKNVEKEAIDSKDSEKEDVKLEIEDYREPSREEKEEGDKEEEGEKGKDVISNKEESEEDANKPGNLDGNYRGLVDQLRQEFGKGEQISLEKSIAVLPSQLKSLFLKKRNKLMLCYAIDGARAG